MQKFIDRLIHCGYSPSDAHSTCHDFIREFNIEKLEEFISSLERDLYVDRV